MLNFLKPQVKNTQVPQNEILKTYLNLRTWSLSGTLIGYMGFYLMRNNVILATPLIKNELHISNSDIGTITGALLMSYGIAKGLMSIFADKADPKKYMALGLILCALVNILLGFSNAFYAYVGLVIALGVFQAMGAGPSFVVIANWYPQKERGFYTAIWNISHNIGGGSIAPIVSISAFLLSTLLGISVAEFNEKYWHINHFYIPAILGVLISLYVLYSIHSSPYNEGLGTLDSINSLRGIKENQKISAQDTHHLSSFQIFFRYVFLSKNAWYTVLMETSGYIIRFGLVTWLPIYMLNVKGFTKEQMSTAFLVFEWAAIPSTLIAGFITDKFFKGNRMPLAILLGGIIAFIVFGYFNSNSLSSIIIFTALAGCLIYVLQFLIGLSGMDVVPSFAVGSCVGLRGFMAYIVGGFIATKVIGWSVDYFHSWNAGLYIVLGACVFNMICGILCYFGIKKMNEKSSS